MLLVHSVIRPSDPSSHPLWIDAVLLDSWLFDEDIKARIDVKLIGQCGTRDVGTPGLIFGDLESGCCWGLCWRFLFDNSVQFIRKRFWLWMVPSHLHSSGFLVRTLCPLCDHHIINIFADEWCHLQGYSGANMVHCIISSADFCLIQITS